MVKNKNKRKKAVIEASSSEDNTTTTNMSDGEPIEIYYSDEDTASTVPAPAAIASTPIVSTQPANLATPANLGTAEPTATPLHAASANRNLPVSATAPDENPFNRMKIPRVPPKMLLPASLNATGLMRWMSSSGSVYALVAGHLA